MATSPLVENAKVLWRGLQPRERVLITGAAALLCMTVMYALLWVPMQRDLRHLRTALPEAEAHLTVMRAQLAQVQQLRAARPTSNQSISLQTAVEQTASAGGIQGTITRLEAHGPKTVDVSLDGVGFDQLVRWLADLQRKHPVTIEAATVDRQSGPGLVNARLTLRALAP